MIFFEDVQKSFLGLVKTVIRNQSVSQGEYVIKTREVYVLGFRVKEKSEFKKSGFADKIAMAFGAVTR